MASAREELEYRMAASGAATEPAPLLEWQRAQRVLRSPTHKLPPEEPAATEREDIVMSRKSGGPQMDPSDTTTGGIDDGPSYRARRWYQPRPQPRCAADLAGFNWTYWLFGACLVILIFIP